MINLICDNLIKMHLIEKSHSFQIYNSLQSDFIINWSTIQQKILAVKNLSLSLQKIFFPKSSDIDRL